MSGGVVCYIERSPGGTGIRRLRLIAAGLARTWNAPESRPGLSDGAGPGPEISAARAGATWISETLAAVGLKRLAAVCVDSEGAVCAWLSAPSPEPSVVRATLVQSSMEGDGSGAGVGAARLLTMSEGDPALTGQTSLQALATLEPDEEEEPVKKKGLSLRKKGPTGPIIKQRYAVVAIPDAIVRVLLDELDQRGIEIERVVSLWHAMAEAWDRSERAGGLDSGSIGGAVILVEPHGRLVWAWTRAGQLVAGGSMRLSTHVRRPTPAVNGTPAAPAPADGGGEPSDALATQTQAAEAARRSVFDGDTGEDPTAGVEFSSADAGRLAVDWLAWSAQLGHCPERAVCLSVPAVTGGGLGPEALFSNIAKAWPGATIDGAVHQDPIGATIGRLAGLGPDVDSSGDVIKRADDDLPYHFRPRQALTDLSRRPGVADRRLHQWVGAFLCAAAGLVGVIGWQIRATMNAAQEQVRLAQAEYSSTIREVEAIVPGLDKRKPLEAIAGATKRVADQNRALKQPRPILEETVRVLTALQSVNDGAGPDAAKRTLMTELEMTAYAGKVSLAVPDAGTGPTILEKVIESDGVLQWTGTTTTTNFGGTGTRTYVLLAPWPETNVVTPGRKPAAAPPPAPPADGAGTPPAGEGKS